MADGRRLLFTESEYKALLVHKYALDDELNGGRWAFLELFGSIYKKALVRGDSIINKVTQKPFDYSVNESIGTTKNEVYHFATDVPALMARWLISTK